jgi:putative acetyltransferase
MNCFDFKPEMQYQLDDFFETMYASRGLKYEPQRAHKDLQNILSIYQANGGGFWVLFDGKKIIGAVGLKILDKINGVGEIKRMAVLPKYQGKGYGKLLLNNLINEARIRSLIILRLDTMKSYDKALSLYRKAGFYEIERYNDNVQAEVYMELRL